MKLILVPGFALMALLVFVAGRYTKPAPTYAPLSTAEPSPTPFATYSVPAIPKKSGYTIVFVGDSMTWALGPHPSRFSDLMNRAYGDETFAIDNYSVPSKSILSLEEILKTKSRINDLEVEPILTRELDMVIIESFGHNPLSQFPLEQGLAKQEEILDKVMLQLIDKSPQPVVVFLATLAPNPLRYARNTLDLSAEQRANFAAERRAYIENFIAYAKTHQIPLVNVFEKSFNKDGSFKQYLISPKDNIHPSQDGIEFIQQELVNFILESNYLPR